MEWLDLPYSYGGEDLKSLSRSADEEFLGSFTTIASSLISFYRKTELPIYIRIAEALEALADTVDQTAGEVRSNPTPMLTAIRDVAERVVVDVSPLPTSEFSRVNRL
jgi:hypothetical protein